MCNNCKFFKKEAHTVYCFHCLTEIEEKYKYFELKEDKK